MGRFRNVFSLRARGIARKEAEDFEWQIVITEYVLAKHGLIQAPVGEPETP
jgi:hypothetical protein